MEIAGKTVLITGGAKRVGAALARGFAAQGARVLIHCRESQREAEALASSLPGAAVIPCDFADLTKVATLLDKTGTIDILINNASIFEPARLIDESPEELERQFNINFFAPLSLIRQFAGQSRKGEGAIINLLDQEILGRVPESGGYSLSRRALHQATLRLALELAPMIRVNGIAPGPVLPPVQLPESRMEKSRAMLPLKRTVSLDDLTQAVLFLAANSSITGQILAVDCGQSLLK